MSKYLLFAGDSYYSGGPVSDFIHSFDGKNEAIYCARFIHDENILTSDAESFIAGEIDDYENETDSRNVDWVRVISSHGDEVFSDGYIHGDYTGGVLDLSSKHGKCIIKLESDESFIGESILAGFNSRK